MVWNGSVEKKELQPGCKCCCQCRGVVSPHGYWTEYTLRTSPWDNTATTYIRTWGTPFTLRRAPEIAATSTRLACTPCVWISDDKKWALGDGMYARYVGHALGSGNVFAPRADGACGYESAFRVNFLPYDGGSPVANTNDGGLSWFIYGGAQLGTPIPLAKPPQVLSSVMSLAVEVQPSGRFVCCSKSCPNAPSGNLELTITGCGSPIVVTLLRIDASLSVPLKWKSADNRFEFWSDFRTGFVVFIDPLAVPYYGREIISSWVSCDPGAEFLAVHRGEYLCPDAVTRNVTMEIRQSSGGVMPGADAYGYGYADCFPYGNLPPSGPGSPDAMNCWQCVDFDAANAITARYAVCQTNDPTTIGAPVARTECSRSGANINCVDCVYIPPPP